MIQPVFRATFRSRPATSQIYALARFHNRRAFSGSRWLKEDPRLQDIGRVIDDEYAVIRDNYSN
jgi:triacylglycerol lipase